MLRAKPDLPQWMCMQVLDFSFLHLQLALNFFLLSQPDGYYDSLSGLIFAGSLKVF